MNNKFKTLAAVAIGMATAAAPAETPRPAEVSKTVSLPSKQEGIQQEPRRQGQGISINDYGGLDFEYPRMARTNPIYDPTRPHPKQSYRSQQRAAKKRRNR